MRKGFAHKGAILGYSLFFVISLFVCLFWQAPLAWVIAQATNQSQSNPDVRLVAPSGSLYQGKWQAIVIDGHELPLDCQYQALTPWRFWQLTLDVTCHSPLNFLGMVTLSHEGIRVSEASLQGRLEDARHWLDWLAIPVPVDGNINLAINALNIEQGVLTQLSLSGDTQQLQVADFQLFERVQIETQSSILSESQPIVLTVTANEALTLNLRSEIDGRRYQTVGQLTGDGVGHFGPYLAYFGQRVADDTLEIRLQGSLLP